MIIERKKRSRSLIPLPSMADIAFILLIFFLLTSAIDIEKDIRLELPETNVSQSESKKYFMVWIDGIGRIIMKGEEGDNEKLYTFAKYRSIDNPDVKALIGADRKVPYRVINGVMEILRNAGVHNIVLISKKKSSDIR